MVEIPLRRDVDCSALLARREFTALELQVKPGMVGGKVRAWEGGRKAQMCG